MEEITITVVEEYRDESEVRVEVLGTSNRDMDVIKLLLALKSSMLRSKEEGINWVSAWMSKDTFNQLVEDIHTTFERKITVND